MLIVQNAIKILKKFTTMPMKNKHKKGGMKEAKPGFPGSGPCTNPTYS
jgi:hypothetical protein